MSARSPFSPLTVLALVVAGGGLLLAMLWMLGTGLALGDTNDGGGHAGGRGLNGYAALYRLLDKTGHPLTLARDAQGLRQPGLLILTPPADADTKALSRIVAEHRAFGPVLVVLPKWQATLANTDQPGARKGWVTLGEAAVPAWRGFLDDVTVGIGHGPVTLADPYGPTLHPPRPDRMMAAIGDRLHPIISAGQGLVLAGRYDDGLTLVFEPDLLNNAGLARSENAAFALALVRALLPAGERRITFDLTLNGFARSPNLLTLAFTPPYLAATLCLILAAVAAGWRAFHRFGPPLAEDRDIALGKRALAQSTAALILRAGRYHLLPGAYGDAARARITVALGLPGHADPASTDAAIDRACLSRDPDALPFTTALAALRAARRPAEILRAAQSLHSIERMLTR